MNTRSSPTHKLLPLFRGPYYKRRRLKDLSRPVISKLPGVDTWVCQYRWGHIKGFGLTPTQAYNAWKSLMVFRDI